MAASKTGYAQVVLLADVISDPVEFAPAHERFENEKGTIRQWRESFLSLT